MRVAEKLDWKRLKIKKSVGTGKSKFRTWSIIRSERVKPTTYDYEPPTTDVSKANEQYTEHVLLQYV
jgi:hypothetical protein